MTDLRKLARDKPCMVRIEGCDGGGATTVLAHYRMAGTCGVGMKPDHMQAAWACCRCHDAIDGRSRRLGMTKESLRLAHAEGVLRTQAELRRMGAIR